ncbi:MAG TPA: arginine repressor [Candidatus Limnocylindria bacterium]|nr:arginine repressor [Candidatus Limnocylindria bacterium]
MNSDERRRIIRRLIAAGGVHTQADLVARLADDGAEVTQATISRDLASLGVVRGMHGGRLTYLLPDDVAEEPAASAERRLRRLLIDLPLSIDAVTPLVVLHTAPGAANAIASALDLSRWDEVVGTVAGDDTIFVACRGSAALQRFQRRIEALRGTSSNRPLTAGAGS